MDMKNKMDHFTKLGPGYRYLKDPSITHILCKICCKQNGRLCTGCSQVAYCSQKCQKVDWPKHKFDCKPAVIVDKALALKVLGRGRNCHSYPPTPPTEDDESVQAFENGTTDTGNSTGTDLDLGGGGSDPDATEGTTEESCTETSTSEEPASSSSYMGTSAESSIIGTTPSAPSSIMGASDDLSNISSAGSTMNDLNDECSTPTPKSQGQNEEGQYSGKLMSRRTIKQFDIVADVPPIMMCCNNKGMSRPPCSILCLNCTVWYQSSPGHRCSECGWPVCSPNCEKGYLHSNFECPVFTQRKVRPPSSSGHTQFYDDIILALRCILLKKVDCAKFEELFEWKDVCAIKNKFPVWNEYDKTIKNFLLNECGLLGFVDIKEDDIIDYLKVIDACTLMQKDRVVIVAGDFGKAFYCAKYVFPMKLLVTEECAPNCKWSIKHSPKLEECSLRLHTALELQPNTYISACFTDISEIGASFQLRYINERFKDPCTCRRCLDPTELGSYFSALKCHGPETNYSCGGSLLPIDPARSTSNWCCVNPNCHVILDGIKITNYICGIYHEMMNAGSDFYALLTIIWKYESVLHPNHFLNLMASTICVGLFWGSVRGFPFYSPRYAFFVGTINLANDAIRILNLTCPGATLQKGRILFQLQIAYAYKHLRDIRRYMEWGTHHQGHRVTFPSCAGMPADFWHLQKIQEDAYAVLMTEPYGSLEHEMAIVLQVVIEEQLDLLCLSPPDVPLDSPSIYNLHKIYTRFSHKTYYPAVPVFDDKDVNEFVTYTGPCAMPLMEKLSLTI